MLREVEILHDEAVTRLVQKIRHEREITFKAPTGSGKTYMMADLMDRILGQLNDVIFIVSSLSKSNLAGQNYEKFIEYQQKGEFKHLNPYLINSEVSGEESLYIPTNHNVYVLPRDLYKEDSLLMRGPMTNFLDSITSNLYKDSLNKRIFVIKDECHQATNNLDKLSHYFDKIVNFSATPDPKKKQRPDVEITEEQAINAKLIKEIVWGNLDETVGDAINQLITIKKSYYNLLGVNPCLIIQISNKEKAEEELAEIYQELDKHQSLKWMLIVGDDKKCDTNDTMKAKKLPVSRWKDYAKGKDSTIDVIIFKMVITEGWDIPRACMLYQTRASRSKQLDMQVMGRVRRNPRLLDFEKLSPEAQELAMKAWIWGVKKEEGPRLCTARLYDEPKDITEHIKVKTTVLKPLTQKKGFDLPAFIASQPYNPSEESIFTRYRKLKRTDASIQQMCMDYAAGDFSRWFTFTKHLEAIVKESNKYVCDYASSMEIKTDADGNPLMASFPVESTYMDNNDNCKETIKDWVWKNKGTGSKSFSFDSNAEREWANVLNMVVREETTNPYIKHVGKQVSVGKNNPEAGQLRIDGTVEAKKLNLENKYLWGKNFLANSEIKYEYCSDGVHSSFPDFVMEDGQGRIHLFEVKSVNKSNNFGGADSQEYKDKIMHLSACYKQASILTGHIFYLPIQKEDKWQITRFKDGEEDLLTQEQFEDFLKECQPISTDPKGNTVKTNETDIKTDENDEAEDDIDILDTYEIAESEKYTRYLPLYEIQAACGGLEDGGCPPEDEIIGWIDVKGTIRRPSKNMFIIRAKGKSMIPEIEPGELCIFELYGRDRSGSRNGDIVLAKQIGKDNDYNCQYTIKEFYSEKDPKTGYHTRIELRPINTDGYEPIVLNPEDEGEVGTLAIFKCVVR